MLIELTRRELGATTDQRALDVGCGTGETDAYLEGRFRELHGVDVAPSVVETAAQRNPWVHYSAYDGVTLPYGDGEFDLVFAICVVHHVPPADWPRFVRELARVVRPGGVLALLEHNPLNPLTRLAVARCEFDEDAVLLSRRRALALVESAGLEPLRSRYFLFFPWRSRALAALERPLGVVPFGAQYVAAGRRRT